MRAGLDNLLESGDVAIVDSGAGGHFLGNKNTLTRLREVSRHMHTASGTVLLETAGDLELRVEDAQGNSLEPLVLRDASVMKHSPLNLVSVGVLCKEGSIFHFERGNSWFTHNGHRFPIEEKNGLFIIRLNQILQAQDLADLHRACLEQGFGKDIYKEGSSVYGCAATFDLWHQRFGHASKQRLKFLYDAGGAEGFSTQGSKHKHDSSCKCPTCLAVHNDKVHIGDVRKYADTVTQVGQKLVADLCGPFPESVEGYRYVISFTDTYSRFSACYFLKRKSDAEAALLSLIAYYKREGFVIKEMHTDGGGEFGGGNERLNVEGDADAATTLNFIYTRVCDEHDIKHIVTPRNRPELHGLAERWNRTVMKMANSMLYASRLSHVLWASAVAHANMLRNRLPLKGLGRFTPYELFFKKRPRVGELRVWGCDAYTLLPPGQVPGQQNRRRLLYVGQTPDRLGFRCFDPITFKFSTHFELLFDENSSKKRINALREYDIRRELARRGKLEELPLIGDDFDFSDPEKLAQQDSERRLYPIPLPTPDHVESGGASEVRARNDDVSANATSTQNTRHTRITRTTRHTRQPGAGDAAESGLNGPSRAGSQSAHRTSGQDTSTDDDSSYSSDDEDSMGSASEPPSASPTHSKDNVIGHSTDGGRAIRHKNLRQGREPAQRAPETVGVADEATLTEQDGAEVLINDEDADKYGPLSEGALSRWRKRVKSDSTVPIRPLRILPIGRVVEDTDEFRAFRRYALEKDLPIKLVDNPKEPRSESWKRYNRYQLATTLKELIELSVTAKSPSKRREQQAKARADIVNDSLRGFILFPQNENPESTHFVDAAELARANNTVNVHSLYSRRELNVSRRAYLKQRQRKLGELDKAFQVQGYLTFHDQIRFLWDGDAPASLSDCTTEADQAQYAALVAQLLAGDAPDPSSYKEATSANHPEHEQWRAAVQLERSTLEQRGTWELVPKSTIGKNRPVRCKYVLKKKRNKNGSIQWKARLVACGYSQIAGMNFSSDEVYAGVCSYSGIRFLLSYACQKGYILSQADISSAYLESHLDEEVYMNVPPDMYVNGKPPTDEHGNELVCRLRRGLYGLKQSGYLWNECFREFLTKDAAYNMGFVEMTGEPNMYRKTFELNGKPQEILLGIYVDDSLICSSSEEARQWFMERLAKRFPVNNKSSGIISVDEPGLLLSMNVSYDKAKGVLRFDQKKAIEALAKKLGVTERPRTLPISPDTNLPKLKQAEVDAIEYLSIVGSCLHICQVSRPDCSYAVGVLSRHSATPGKEHRQAALDLVSYMYHTRNWSIQYTRSADGNQPSIFEGGSGVHQRGSKAMTIEERLVASVPTPQDNSPDMFVDADFGGDKDTRRSTSGMVVLMNGGPISWQSRLQKLCAQSTAESEIYAVVDAVKEAIHLRLLCEETGIRQPNQPMRVWEDNNACVHMGHGLRGSKAAKHFEVRLRFLHERIMNGDVEFARINTKDQLADGFTKALPGPAFTEFRKAIMYCV